MSTTDNQVSNAVLVGRLSIERCQTHVAHLHALMHLCEPPCFGMDELVAESARRIMQNLESELEHSAEVMGLEF